MSMISVTKLAMRGELVGTAVAVLRSFKDELRSRTGGGLDTETLLCVGGKVFYRVNGRVAVVFGVVVVP